MGGERRGRLLPPGQRWLWRRKWLVVLCLVCAAAIWLGWMRSQVRIGATHRLHATKTEIGEKVELARVGPLHLDCLFLSPEGDRVAFVIWRHGINDMWPFPTLHEMVYPSAVDGMWHLDTATGAVLFHEEEVYHSPDWPQPELVALGYADWLLVNRYIRKHRLGHRGDAGVTLPSGRAICIEVGRWWCPWRRELFVIPKDGEGPPVQLSRSSGEWELALTKDERSVVFRDRGALYLLRLDKPLSDYVSPPQEAAGRARGDSK